jgi:hypothetical protein
MISEMMEIFNLKSNKDASGWAGLGWGAPARRMVVAMSVTGC